MEVLVTGGCGYVGSVLVPRLQARADIETVRILDSLTTGSPGNLLTSRWDDGLSFREGDVRDAGAVEAAMAGVDAVIHLAAITGAASTHDREAETMAVNRDGTATVVSAARRLDVQNVVFASSCNVYGRATTTDIDETTDPAPLNPYARAKHEAEGLVEEFASAPGRTATILRLSTLYGYAPGIRFNLVVNDFVFRAVSDRPLTVYGDGTNWRPFMHVEDAARAFVHATCTPAAWEEHIYNVGGSDENYRIEEIAAIVRETVGSTGAVTYLAEEDPGPSYHVDFGRLESTDFAPTQTLRAGVQGLADRFTTETQHVRSA